MKYVSYDMLKNQGIAIRIKLLSYSACMNGYFYTAAKTDNAASNAIAYDTLNYNISDVFLSKI